MEEVEKQPSPRERAGSSDELIYGQELELQNRKK
jgi:hypothetical protein